MRHPLLPAVVVCVGWASTVHADLLVADYLNSRVLQFSEVNGSLIDPDFIQFEPTDGIPFDMIRVQDEIWISDPLFAQIVRYSLDGQTRLGAISGFSATTFGMEYVPEQNAVFVVTGDSSGNSIDRVNTATHAITGSFAVFGAIDVIQSGGSLLVTDEDRNRVDRYAYDGTYLGLFADIAGDTGLRSPYQIVSQPDGSLYVGAAGFGSDDGGIAGYSDGGTPFGAWHAPTDGFIGIGTLDDGKFLVTLNGGGAAIFDPSTETITPVGPDDVLGFFVGSVVIPAPATVPLLGLGLLWAVRRRR